MTPAEIGKLTLVQVQHLFFRRRDKQGNIRRDPDRQGKTPDPHEEFVSHWRKWGLSRERAEELWREKRAEEKKATRAKRVVKSPRRVKQ